MDKGNSRRANLTKTHVKTTVLNSNRYSGKFSDNILHYRQLSIYRCDYEENLSKFEKVHMTTSLIHFSNSISPFVV